MGREVAYLAGVLDLTKRPPVLVTCEIRKRDLEPSWGSSFVGRTLVFSVFEAAADTFPRARAEILRALFESSRYPEHSLDAFRECLDERERARAFDLGLRDHRRKAKP